MKHSSAHSPRNLGCLIRAPAPSFVMNNCRYPLPKEKSGPERGRAASNTTLHLLSHKPLRGTTYLPINSSKRSTPSHFGHAWSFYAISSAPDRSEKQRSKI